MLSFATGGNSDNPTPVQITRAFRKLFFSSFLNTSSGNCAEDFDDLLGQCAEKPNVPIVVATHLSLKCLKPWTLGQLTTGS